MTRWILTKRTIKIVVVWDQRKKTSLKEKIVKTLNLRSETVKFIKMSDKMMTTQEKYNEKTT